MSKSINFMKIKNSILIIFLSMLAGVGYGQENMATLSGGYVFANVESTDVNGSGFRINGLYEYNPGGSNWAHGISIGYIGLTGETTTNQTIKYDINTWPIYYAPKYLFGNESFKGFIKGSIGWQFSNIDRIGVVSTISDNDAGFTAGGGLGAMYFFNEKVFLNVEYELLYLGNSFYKDGLLNTVSLGIGFKF
jgi:hypothetical protein